MFVTKKTPQDFRAFVACAFDFHVSRMMPQERYVIVCVSMGFTPLTLERRQKRLMLSLYHAAQEGRLAGSDKAYIATRKGLV